MKTLLLVIAALVALPCWAGEVEYRPGGKSFSSVWDRFYKGDHEPELDDPLIAAGPPMTPAIVEAIQHKDMKYRRYAIGALGQIGDKRAIPPLEKLLQDKTEIDYFRGDALQSIYRLDQKRGTVYAERYAGENEYLRMISEAIKKREPWLLEPTKED